MKLGPSNFKLKLLNDDDDGDNDNDDDNDDDDDDDDDDDYDYDCWRSCRPLVLFRVTLKSCTNSILYNIRVLYTLIFNQHQLKLKTIPGVYSLPNKIM